MGLTQENFIGAGIFSYMPPLKPNKNGEILGPNWDSGTCIEAFSRDRPTEKSEADETLEAVKNAIFKTIEEATA